MASGSAWWTVAVAAWMLALPGCAARAGGDAAEAPVGAAPRGDAAPPEPPVAPEAGQPVTLAQLFAYADANAPALLVSRARSAAGGAEVEGAETWLRDNPELAVSAGGRTVAGVTRFEFEAGIEQRLEIAGERGARIEAAERARDALRAEIDVARWELHAQVHALFYQLLVREQQLQAADKIAAFTERVGEVIDKRVQAGEASPLEAIVARAELARAGQLVVSARQSHQAASFRLAELIGWPSEHALRVSGTLEAPRKIGDAAALIAAARDTHPSKRWLALEVVAADARRAREDREAWPEPTVGVRYAREAEAGAAAHVWMGTLKLPLPIWERNQAGRARARAELGVAQAEDRAFDRALAARIAGAVSRVDAAAERTLLYGSDILPALEGNLDKLQRAFELGEIDLLELAQIQQRILVTQTDALTALEEYYEALAALEALSGVDVLSGAPSP